MAERSSSRYLAIDRLEDCVAMTENEEQPRVEQDVVSTATSFQANDRTQSPPDINLPDELWLTVLESPCTFTPDIFAEVMLNLIKNPNITSSHLFRADIFYDSEKDYSLAGSNGGLATHLKAEYRPLEYQIPGFTLTRTMVRQMIPRNPQLDKPLVQTCHFFSKDDDQGEENVVVYLPHINDPSEIPFYHPAVSRLAFTHNWPSTTSSRTSNHTATSTQTTGIGTISLSYSLFPSTTGNTGNTSTSLPPKFSRTALRLLQTVHKHGQGQLRGYEKRVHHDQIIPQKRYQDTYARLKAKYGRLLSEKWVEVTDPGKHVFEDIGIAAFLVELWGEMYGDAGMGGGEGGEGSGEGKLPFPGFVDIGCGNGVLTYILLAEGYEGWGFDARERKTWSIFPSHIQAKLQRRLLVPSIFQTEPADLWHDGIFNPRTFIISNHADELTAWTPLLAYLNDAAFIAIPCCSHDLAGSRFRAPPRTKASKASNTRATARLPQQQPPAAFPSAAAEQEVKHSLQAAETGTLQRTEAQKKMPSAYSTLCSYIASLAEEVGFEPEKDVLRIPSTRNQCIVGRRRRKGDARPREGQSESETSVTRLAKVQEIVERELGKSVRVVGEEWVERAEKLARKPGSGH